MIDDASLDSEIREAFSLDELNGERLDELQLQINRVSDARRGALRRRAPLAVAFASALAAMLFVGVTIGWSGLLNKPDFSEPGPLAMPVQAAGPSLIALKFHADWCAESQVVSPQCERLLAEFGNQDIVFVNLDLTDEMTTLQSKKLAASLGLLELWEVSRKDTGQIVIVDQRQGRVVERLTMDDDYEVMRAAIGDALAGIH